MEEDAARFFQRNPYISSCPTTSSRVVGDVVATVRTFHLSHKIANWGDTSQRKLCIYGALPFRPHKGRKDDDDDAARRKDQVRSVPVQVWLAAGFPVDPPTLFLVPSHAGDRIPAQHPNIDATGLLYAPQLAQWDPHHSSLKKLLVAFVRAFSIAPPMYRVPETVEPSASAFPADDRPAVASGGGGGEADEERLCVVCLTEAKDTVLVPCGHLCACSSCCNSLSVCPMCRVQIQFRQRVYV